MDELQPSPTPIATPLPSPAADVSLAQLQESVDMINAKLDHSVVASDVIITYGTFYVPLILIVLMLWWFFRQFINQYR